MKSIVSGDGSVFNVGSFGVTGLGVSKARLFSRSVPERLGIIPLPEEALTLWCWADVSHPEG